jgi:GNAT superfamily N-acetyltransferase
MGYRIRQAIPEDIAPLPDIERQAAQRFLTCLDATGLTADMLAQTTAIADFDHACQQGHLWVAVENTGEKIGFALVVPMGNHAHLEELDVLPTCGNRGIGSALVTTVCQWAQGQGYAGVTLRTFRTVPWNAPFYLRRGFRIVDPAQVSPQQVALVAAEQRQGLRADRRVAMLWEAELGGRGGA